uniref:Uncharacterized protein n=1 Tax=Anguilla anguilla TaxID=7936 RepID=A0A0E9RY59_ANGAN
MSFPLSVRKQVHLVDVSRYLTVDDQPKEM